MSRLRVLLVLVLAGAHASPDMCRQDTCECHAGPHPSWTFINCTLTEDQGLQISEGDVPEETTDISVTGGDTIMFGPNSLSGLTDGRYLQVIGSHIVLIKKYAATNLNIVSLFLDVKDCDTFRIEEKAFSNIKGPLSVTVENCKKVFIEGEAFSWLLSVVIKNVGELVLSPGTFVLDPTAANIGQHGPGLIIELTNVTVPELTSQTFGSSAASITLKHVVVHEIRPDAFSANTYNRFEAYNCSFDHIHGEAFAKKTLIHSFKLQGCKITTFGSGGLHSAVAIMNITDSIFGTIETGAINTTAANFHIEDSKFIHVEERGFVLASWYSIFLRRNTFDFLAPNAIVSVGFNRMHELVFAENDIETVSENSLGFIGEAYAIVPGNVVYSKNYFGQACNCNISSWLAESVGSESGAPFHSQTYCTVDEFFARCFNVPEQNMLVTKFLHNVCNADSSIKCEPFQTKSEWGVTEIKNPRFPHKKDIESLSDRNKKVIGIVIVTVLGCVIFVMFISLIRWMNRKGYCAVIKNFLISSQSSCGSICDRICSCGNNRGVDNAGSINHLSIHEYSERRRLNEPRFEMTQETAIPNVYYEENVQIEDKTTQTLPEELTKELLENLKNRLDDPDNYKEAREMIEHLYELIKVEEGCHHNTPVHNNLEENIYELPIINTMPRIGKNQKTMISVGTKSPSLEKLMPLSPYNRTTALVHEYFEPKDFAVHLYAEITNSDRDLNKAGKRQASSRAIPDVVARGPYLDAMRNRDKYSSSPSTSTFSSPSPPSAIQNGSTSPSQASSPEHLSTIKSNKSTVSNGSVNMMNRPLPEKPTFDPGEGSSTKC